MEKLTELKNGVMRRIVLIDGAAPLKIKRRLLELGFTSGQKVKVVRKSLLGETYLIELRGYSISMRKELAKYLIVE